MQRVAPTLGIRGNAFRLSQPLRETTLMKRSNVLTILAVTAALGAGTTIAVAATGDDEREHERESERGHDERHDDGAAELRLLDTASLTLVDAITAAESASGGRATDAELEGEDGVAAFEVTVVTTEGIEQDLVVDAASGAVTEKTDRHDGDDDDD